MVEDKWYEGGEAGGWMHGWAVGNERDTLMTGVFGGTHTGTVYGCDRIASFFNPAVREDWALQRGISGDLINLADHIAFLSKHLKDPRADDSTRDICNNFMGGLFLKVIVPLFEKYVLVVYAKDHNLDAAPRLIRDPNTKRSIGHADPGVCVCKDCIF